jgi:hypothetical protein
VTADILRYLLVVTAVGSFTKRTMARAKTSASVGTQIELGQLAAIWIAISRLQFVLINSQDNC